MKNGDIEDISHRCTEDFIFKYDALDGQTAQQFHPFTKEGRGYFMYMTNRKSERYSYLYDNLDLDEVYSGATFSSGYTALLICEKIKFFENTKYPSTEFIASDSDTERYIEGKYCIFQNPLNKLIEYGCHDILEFHDNKQVAYINSLILSWKSSVLLAKIKHSIDWH